MIATAEPGVSARTPNPAPRTVPEPSRPEAPPAGARATPRPLAAHLDPADQAILSDYLDAALSLLEIARRHRLRITDLLDWAERPDIVDVLTRFARLCNTRAANLAAGASIAAVETTARCLSAPNPETARRAASTLIRLAPKPASRPQTSRGHKSEDPAPAVEAPETPSLEESASEIRTRERQPSDTCHPARVPSPTPTNQPSSTQSPTASAPSSPPAPDRPKPLSNPPGT